MVSETRYFRSDSWLVNGLTALKLLTSQSGNADGRYRWVGYAITVSWGIRVWKRTEAGVETEITSGSLVATVTRTEEGAGIQSNTWNCPETVLVSTDAIIVRVYINIDGWIDLLDTWITEQLGSTKLNSATWTVYYYTRWIVINSGIQLGFIFDTTTYNSRTENFTYAVVVVKSVGDSFGLTDTVSCNKVIPLSDSFGLTDSISRNKTLPITDSFGLTDVPLITKVFAVFDAFGMTDVIQVITAPVHKVYKLHLPMIRLLMRPRSWAKIKRGVVEVGIRRPHKPFVPQRPAEGVEE